MNDFKEIKKLISEEDVIYKYLGNPKKTCRDMKWYLSPFRSEKTASFCVSNKGIHDFGESRHYDIISFTQRYFGVEPLEALKILCNDFGITLNDEKYDKEKYKQIIKQREQERKHKEDVEKWYNEEMIKICDEIQTNKECLCILSKSTYFEALLELYKEEQELEYRYEMMTTIGKERLYLERR